MFFRSFDSAHKLNQHAGLLSKAAAKQNRQVDVELFIRGSAGSQAMRRRGLMNTDDYDMVRFSKL